MSKNKINILSRNETKRNTVCRRLDNKCKKIYNVACKHQSQGGFIQNFCVNKFCVLTLC